MTKDLHPHWTSTDRSDAEHPRSSSDASALWRDAEESGEGTNIEHVHVAMERGAWPSALSLLLALLCLASLSVFFFYGMDRIRGDLLSEMRTPAFLTISDAGITPSEVTMKAGETLAIRNDSSAAQQLQSDQRTIDGSALLRTPIIPAHERGEVTIPAEAAGGTLFLRSTLIPTLAVSLSVEPAVPAQVFSPAVEQAGTDTSSAQMPVPSTSTELGARSAEGFPPAMEMDAGEIPIPELPVPPAVTTPAFVAVTPPVPSAPAPHIASPVVTVGNVPSSATTAWPSMLRINRYTVGSPYVSPVQAVRRAEEAVRGAVHAAAPGEQPATGPGLWMCVLITLGAMPLVMRRKPQHGETPGKRH